jgi:predicted esterase
MDIPFIAIDASAPHTHTVVFLHGRGDDARNFAASLAYSPDSRHHSLVKAFPSFRWVFPQAPMRKCASSPETWRQWFDVWNVRDFAERQDLAATGLKEVVPAIHRILADEAALLNGRWDRVVLAGISMGAATSAHVLFNLDIPAAGGGRLAAFIGFSGSCPFAGSSLAEMRGVLALGGVPDNDDVLRNTPMLLEHCVDDPLVLIRNGRGLRDTLREFGAQVAWKEYLEGGHWFNSPSGMDDAVEFLNMQVLGNERSVEASSTQPGTSLDVVDMP